MASPVRLKGSTNGPETRYTETAKKSKVDLWILGELLPEALGVHE
jgi:hypothetical protein